MKNKIYPEVTVTNKKLVRYGRRKTGTRRVRLVHGNDDGWRSGASVVLQAKFVCIVLHEDLHSIVRSTTGMSVLPRLSTATKTY
jgi:hypothetical protein